MIIKEYNPSPLEVRFVEILEELKNEISERLVDFNVTKIESNKGLDNPTIDFFLKDEDGDAHEVILMVIQKPDETAKE